jgi:CheY-like chemotaxis protein
MDIQMSELDGYTTATALRARERGHRTPIVAMTGSLGPEARDRCLQAGMDDYLPKPIDLANLCAMVEGWTLGAADWEPASKAEEEDGNGAQHDRPAIMAIVGAEPDTSPPVLDVARLEESCLGIAELRESLLHAFINDVRPRLERLSDSVRAGDGRRLQFEAHGLRGMCLTIGTSACARIFTELETMGRDGRLVEAKAMLLRAVGEVERAERTIGEHMRGLEQSKAA